MDCYFHSNVPSVAPCADCGKPICATCRDNAGACPSCRLAAKIDMAGAARQAVAGEVPPRSQQQWWKTQQQTAQQQAAAPQVRAKVADREDSQESRILVALGYPLWPLAVISLFDRKQSRRLRKQAYQAVGFGLGVSALAALLSFMTNLPLIGWTPIAWSINVFAAVLFPLYLVMSVVYGIKAWHGEDVRIPIISDWLDDRLTPQH